MTKMQLGDGQWVPARYEVCGRCRGTGTHTNPSIDGNGITSDEMHELGDDFREDYMNGVYDVQCYECKGERVVLILDEDRATPEQLKEYEDEQRAIYELRQEEEMERRMGA